MTENCPVCLDDKELCYWNECSHGICSDCLPDCVKRTPYKFQLYCTICQTDWQYPKNFTLSFDQISIMLGIVRSKLCKECHNHGSQLMLPPVWSGMISCPQHSEKCEECCVEEKCQTLSCIFNSCLFCQHKEKYLEPHCLVCGLCFNHIKHVKEISFSDDIDTLYNMSEISKYVCKICKGLLPMKCDHIPIEFKCICLTTVLNLK